MARLLAGGLLAAGFASAASAHAVLTPPEASAGANWRGAVRIGHGCEGTPTRLVRVTIPDGVVAVRPRAKYGWLIETTWAPYAKPFEIHGKKVTEGVKTITWKGSALPDHMFDDFEFMARIQPDAAAQDGKLYFPVYQECEKGSFDWTQVPATGQNAHDLKSPAPALALKTAGQGAASSPVSGSQAASARQLTASGGWTRATPNGAKVAGAYVAIANGGPKGDVLLGGRFDVADRVEVHDMTMTDGVMRMRHLEQGLEIPAGGSVELRPGGLHLMLMGLKKQLRQGDAIQGVLTFRDAGDVAVSLPVEAAGAPGPGKPPAGAGHDHGHGNHEH
ncbi:DUF1775 domain-containing protein [Camelimonas sp. ID_303_24]